MRRKVSDEEILRRTEEVIAAGAGIVYGRNVTQHPRPAAILRALRAVLHGGASASDAAAELHR
jgi:fructose-bisphosphate aldolase, class I